MLLPVDAIEELRRRWRSRRSQWLLGGGDWPEEINLRVPTQADVQTERGFAAFGRWLTAWRGMEDVTWRNVVWPQAGAQEVPYKWSLRSASEVALVLGLDQAWCRAEASLQRIKMVWPDAPELHARVARTHFDAISEFTNGELDRVLAVLDWLHRNPASGLFPRQIPVAGIDTKWLSGRARLIGDALAALRPGLQEARFAARAGLRELPDLVRLRVPDIHLAACFSGLDDIAVPVGQLGRLNLPLRRVLMVENLQTGLACDDLPGTLVLMARGYAIEYASAVPWLAQVPVFYWGDIDTHGFAILDRLRAYLPHVRSVLMDEEALLSCPLDRQGTETSVHAAAILPRLTHNEHVFYQELRSGRWGSSARLEQERLDWAYASTRLRAELSD